MGILKKISKIMKKYSVSLAVIEGKKLAEIAHDLFKVKRADIINCIENK